MAAVNGKRKASEMNGYAHELPDFKATKGNNGGRRSSIRDFRLPLPEPLTKCALLLSCGQNEVGQLGFTEAVSEKTRPALVIGAKVVDIAAGGMHSLYLDASGDVWSFGCNDEGALGRNTSLEEEGSSEYEAQKVDLPGECIRITAGDSHSAFLLNDGRVFACGSFRDSHGTMGLNIKGKQQYPVEVLPDDGCFVDIKSGADHLVLLSNRGKVFTVGCAEQGQLGRIAARSAGGEQRKGKKNLLEPGLLNSKSIKFIDAIWTTTYCTFVRNRANGAIFGFGLNNYSQLGVNKKNSETIFTPQLTSFENVKMITGGQHHTLVLTNDNECFAIGRKDYGRLGLGGVAEEVVDKLTSIKSLENMTIVQLECGECCSFAVTKNGKAYSWGMGSNQQLGCGSEDDQYEPVLLTGAQVRDRQVIRISSGGQHTLFLAADNNEPITSNVMKDVKEKAVKTNGQSRTIGAEMNGEVSSTNGVE